MDSGIITLLKKLQVTQPYVPIDEYETDQYQQLKSEYGLLKQTKRGWYLNKDIEWLDSVYLSDQLACDVKIFDEIASTNEAVKDYAPPAVVLTEYQFQGRGRRSHHWLSLPADALTLSVILPCPKIIMGLSVAIGAAIWQNLGADLRLRLKWPNDLVDTHHNKVGGILIEVKGNVVIVGVGMNISMTAELNRQIMQLGRLATGLNTVMGEMQSRNQVAVAIIKSICHTTMNFQSGLVTYQPLITQAHRYKSGDFCIESHQQGEKFSHINNEGIFCTLDGKNQKQYIS